MPNSNLLVSPNIKGDISSCKTETSIINGSERYNIFVQQDVGYATNNCTGKTDYYQTWELTGVADVCIGLIVVIVFLAAVRFIFV